MEKKYDYVGVKVNFYNSTDLQHVGTVDVGQFLYSTMGDLNRQMIDQYKKLARSMCPDGLVAELVTYDAGSSYCTTHNRPCPYDGVRYMLNMQ